MSASAAQSLVLASRNAKKVSELENILSPLHIQVLPVSQFPEVGEVDETGDSFMSNAMLKAEAVSQATGLPALADDSGLMVDALEGAPGIYSARFAGPDASDEDNNRLLLDRLQGLAAAERSARFHCAIALAIPGKKALIFEGQVEGHILESPRGAGGFGYDPLFYCDELSKTFAEASIDEKHGVSHRGKALKAFAEALEEQPELL